jgi:hypothetical protein
MHTQFTALAVEHEIIEQKQHVAPPQSGCRIIPGWASKAKSRLPQGQIKRGSKPFVPERRIPMARKRMECGMQTGNVHRRTRETGDIDRWHQEVLVRRAQTGTQFFRVAQSLIGTVAILAAYVSGVRMLSPLPAAAEVPDVIGAPGEIPDTSVHAVGAQVYECQYGPTGKLVWQFREPVATLLIAGKTVGRHYAGPTWEMSDGSAVSAKVLARAPGASANDIPLLKLEVTARHGSGKLGNVTTIQRLNTQGGTADGACDSSGALLSVPYTADYVFYKKASDQSH